jgi:hypothetical protein
MYHSLKSSEGFERKESGNHMGKKEISMDSATLNHIYLNAGNANSNSTQKKSISFNFCLQNLEATLFIMIFVIHFTRGDTRAASIRQGLIPVHIVPVLSCLSATAMKLG